MNIVDESILLFSRVFLSKFSQEVLYISWYKGLYIVGWERNAKSQFFPNRVVWRLGLTTGLRREFKPQANSLASLGLLSYSATAGMTLQLLSMLHTCANFGGLPVTSHPQVSAASLCILTQSWAFLYTLSLTTLTWFPPKYRVTNAKIQANLARNKANKIVDKIQLYNLPIWLFRDKTLKLTYELGTVEQNSLTPNSRIW